MQKILGALWIGLGLAWFSGVSLIARHIGGYQWIEHMGQTRTVAFLAIMGGLCVLSALSMWWLRRLPKPLAVTVATVSGLHLFNAIGMYILFSTNGRAGAALLPFHLVSAIFPTSTQFVGMPPANVSLLILPVFTLVACLVSLSMRPVAAIESHDV